MLVGELWVLDGFEWVNRCVDIYFCKLALSAMSKGSVQ